MSSRGAVAREIAGGGGLAFGNGRSYGDVCLNPGGLLWAMRGLDRFIAFDREQGLIECEAGVLLKEVLDIVLPHGWFLPVVPGTQFVTVGGAIANDVHGKSHETAGSFGDQVLSFDLVRTDGTTLHCSPTQNAACFAATVGGMGLTGVVTRAQLRLRRVQGPWLECETVPFNSLEAFFQLSENARSRYEYAVSWIDCASGDRGRGVFFQANHCARREQFKAPAPKRVPCTPPISLINGLSLKALNALYYGVQRFKRRQSVQHYQQFFFPLDNVLEWNRIYGPRGFYQYQCVVPRAVQLEATRALLREIARAGLGSFLAVLKTFGDRLPLGLLSFPMPGTTLALDFPNQGERTRSLFERLDAVVLEAGGRLYPAKDARMPRSVFEAGYPRLREFVAFRDPGISSSMSRRLFGD